VLSAITGFETIEEMQKVTKDEVISGLKEMETALVEYEEVTDTALENAGLDLNTFGNTVKNLADPANKNGVVGSFNTMANAVAT
jgi:hypothetical protein